MRVCVCNFPTENEVIESHLYYIFILGKGVTCVDLHLCLHPVLCMYVVSQLAPGLHRDSSPTSPPYRLHCSPHRARWWPAASPVAWPRLFSTSTSQAMVVQRPFFSHHWQRKPRETPQGISRLPDTLLPARPVPRQPRSSWSPGPVPRQHHNSLPCLLIHWQEKLK